jgi:hypothetical protein
LSNIPTAPVFVVQPISQTVVEGDTVTFSALAVGTEPITYQWQEYGNANALSHWTGQTTQHLADVNVQNGDADTYAVLVTNSAGTNISADAILDDITADTAGTDNPMTVTALMPVF